jgi:hypothetical protein
MKIQTFIFNWKGQHNNTLDKIKQFEKIGIETTVINSDDSYTHYDNWYHIGEQSFFTSQMLKATELFDSDFLFHIQADVSYDNWQKLIDDALKYYDKYEWGLYAPNIDYTWYDASKTDVDRLQLEDPNLKMVASTDCSCWFINKDIIDISKDREINFEPYQIGWSFDLVYSAISYLNKYPVIRDYNHTVKHPKGSGYNVEQAEQEMIQLYNSLPEDIQKAFYFIKMDRERLADYYGV